MAEDRAKAGRLTPESVQRDALKLLVFLGADAVLGAALIFGGHRAKGEFGKLMGAAGSVLVYLGFVVAFLLALTLIVWVVVVVTQRRD